MQATEHANRRLRRGLLYGDGKAPRRQRKSVPGLEGLASTSTPDATSRGARHILTNTRRAIRIVQRQRLSPNGP